MSLTQASRGTPKAQWMCSIQQGGPLSACGAARLCTQSSAHGRQQHHQTQYRKIPSRPGDAVVLAINLCSLFCPFHHNCHAAGSHAAPVQQDVDRQQLALCGSQMQRCSAIIVWQIHRHTILHQQADPADVPSAGCLAQGFGSMLQLQPARKAADEVTYQIVTPKQGVLQRGGTPPTCTKVMLLTVADSSSSSGRLHDSMQMGSDTR